MTTRTVGNLYEKHYAGDKARYGVFDALATWRPWDRVLYPGSFIHVTASFFFRSVTYVDCDRNAKRFFARMDDVRELVERYRTYEQTPEIAFHGADYENGIDELDGSFDLLLSLYAGFISAPCKRYLKVGGILAVNNSHGDAGLASIDEDYRFMGVIQGRGDRMHVTESNLDAYFKPRNGQPVTAALLRKLGRSIAYTKKAPVYLFRRDR